jgi:AcrR family transcriptional regulator
MAGKGTNGAPKKSGPDQRAKLLAALAKTGNISDACKRAGIVRTTFYRWRNEDEAYAAQLQEALETAIDDLELVARRRAKKQSDVLLIFLLKAHRPDKYRERKDINLTGGVQLEIVEEIIDGGDPGHAPQANGAGPKNGTTAPGAGRL